MADNIDRVRVAEMTDQVREIQDAVLGYLAEVAEVAPQTSMVDEMLLLRAVAKVGRLRTTADSIDLAAGIGPDDRPDPF